MSILNDLNQQSAARASRDGMSPEEYAYENDRRLSLIEDELERIAESLESIEKQERERTQSYGEFLKELRGRLDGLLVNEIGSAGGPVGQAGQNTAYVSGFPHATGDVVLTHNSVPTGWLECDGTEIRKDEYQELYWVIGERFGTPSRADVFRLPAASDLGGVPNAYSRFIIRT